MKRLLIMFLISFSLRSMEMERVLDKWKSDERTQEKLRAGIEKTIKDEVRNAWEKSPDRNSEPELDKLVESCMKDSNDDPIQIAKKILNADLGLKYLDPDNIDDRVFLLGISLQPRSSTERSLFNLLILQKMTENSISQYQAVNKRNTAAIKASKGYLYGFWQALFLGATSLICMWRATRGDEGSYKWYSGVLATGLGSAAIGYKLHTINKEQKYWTTFYTGKIKGYQHIYQTIAKYIASRMSD